MTGSGERQKQPACIHACLKIGGISTARIALWLAAITIVSFAIGFGILALSGGFPPASGESFSLFRHSAFHTPNTTAVPLDGAVAGDVALTLGAGELRVQGGAPDTMLIETTVFTRAPEWQPGLVQGTNNSRKTVEITEKGHKVKEWFAVNSPNSWTVSLNEKVPVRLDVNVGAGDCTLDLRKVTLESLKVSNGAGDTTIQLGNYPDRRFDATISSGVGDLTLRVPPESNTRIRADTGLGDVTGHGFVQDGNTYITAGFNQSRAVNEITLNQGVGSIILETL